MKHLGDITKIHGAAVPIVDIITGGSPCQDLSVAGRRAGLAGERSGLFMEQIRIIKEMRDECIRQLSMSGSAVDRGCIRPRYMVWENVPGAFSSNGGEDFKAVLEETVKVADKDAVIPEFEGGRWTPCGCVVGDGWSIAWRVHDAQYFGVPQRRKRICLLADFNGDSAGRLLFELRRDTDGVYRKQIVMGFGDQSRSQVQPVAEGLSGDFEKSGKQRKGAAGATESGTSGTSRSISFQERAGKPGGGKGILIQDEHTGALSTLNNQSVCTSIGNGQLHDAMSPSVEVSKTLNCMDDPAKIMVLNDQGGSQMDVSEDVSGTLRAQEHGHQPIVYGVSAYDSNAMKSSNPSSGFYEAETTRTLDNNGGNPACNQGGMIVLEGNGSRESHRGNGFVEGEVMYTLNTIEKHAVCVENHPNDSRCDIREDGVVQTLSGRMGTGGNNVPMVMSEVADGLCAQDGRGDVHTQRLAHPEGNFVLEPVCVGNGQVAQTRISETVGTLNCMHDQQAVMTYGLDRASFNQGANAQYNFSVDEEKVGALTARGPAGVLPCKSVDCLNGRGESVNGTLAANARKSLNSGNVVRIASVVRRLTPMECERLQGFPDHWTDIGEWVDTKGKKHKDADSPRYKALGNSIALPFWMWLAERIRKQYVDYIPTMASLFDGIGGFPFAFQRVGIEPVWASEIEEFPMAVTRLRFPE